jgi:uncharacterized coiled-coil protein SlyX
MGKIKKMDAERTRVTPEELSQAQSLTRQIAEIKLKVAEYGLAHKRAMDYLDHMTGQMDNLQDTLAKKYGERPIDLKTGEFK